MEGSIRPPELLSLLLPCQAEANGTEVVLGSEDWNCNEDPQAEVDGKNGISLDELDDAPGPVFSPQLGIQ